MDVCAKLKGMLRVRKVGHAGTLDPMAKGVLPVAVGIATKDIERVSGKIKEYSTCMLLGLTTDTNDISGKVIARYGGKLPDDESVLKEVLSFIGEYDQLPPMYSAKKVRGKKLYQYAREGKEVERRSKRVEIFDIVIEKIEIPRVYFTVSCSKGTYIRSLIRDIGERLFCGATMEKLTRIRVGDFCISDSLTITDVGRLLKNGGLDSYFYVKSPTALSIGKFDGTHLGHKALFEELKKVACRLSLKTLVIVFLFKDEALSRGEDIRKKIMDLGIDYCVLLKFSDEIRNTEADTFLKDTLIQKYCMKAIVAGDDVSFGKGRKGNVEFLKEQSEKYGFEVRIIKKICFKEDSGEAVISSSLIREKLKEGRMDLVARLLGENYSIRGEIVHGKGIGATKLGLATFNIFLPGEIVTPPAGVYAARYTLCDPESGKMVLKGEGIANLGYAPTVNCTPTLNYLPTVNYASTVNSEDKTLNENPVLHKQMLRLEMHAFSDIGDCYGLMATVELLKFVRAERRFDSLEELKNQIILRDIPAVFDFFTKKDDV